MTDTTLAILAGGEGSRMGKPKALLTLGTEPILQYLLSRFCWPGQTMLVTAPQREHPPGWQLFSSEVCDPSSGGGPLRGILTALEHLSTPLLLVLTVDMPAIRLPHCLPILDHLRQNPAAMGVMMRRTVGGAPRIETFPCALRLGARPVIASRLAGQQRSVHRLLEEPGFTSIEAPADWEEGIWTNLNHPEDLRMYKG
jgi:molybdenum cofactor guanylyltransferase